MRNIMRHSKFLNVIKWSIVLSMLCASSAWAACDVTHKTECYTGTTTKTVIDCENSAASGLHVQWTIDSASIGDTVVVPAGSCSWDTPLSITTPLTLTGIVADPLTTKITSTFTAADTTQQHTNALVYYHPASDDYGKLFRVEYIDFDMDSKAACISLATTVTVNETTHEYSDGPNIMINNNYIHKLGAHRGVQVMGNVSGVVYSNTFDTISNVFTVHDASSSGSWSVLNHTFGDNQKLFFEDNTITNINAGASPISTGVGGRLVARYNTYTSLGALFSWHDMHGNQWGANSSSMGNEVYGEKTTNLGGSLACNEADIRGGEAMVFYNKTIGYNTGSGVTIKEEYSDSGGPGDATAPDGQTQHISNSYVWSIYRGNVLETNYPVSYDHVRISAPATVNDPLTIYENVNFWVQRGTGSGFTGIVDTTCGHYNNSQGCTTDGVGCGTLAEMQAITTCTEGVGFWVKGNENQSCTDISSQVGVNPTYPIVGTLYRCGSSNNWQVYYTPYEYPHPLRSSGEAVTYYTMVVTQPTRGNITSAVALNCGSGGLICSEAYESTESAVITFTPDSGYFLDSTGGSCSGRTNPQTIAMSEARTCTATFSQIRSQSGGTISGGRIQ
jgi:hypothetical protein